MTPEEKARAYLDTLGSDATDAEIIAALSVVLIASALPAESPPHYVFSVEWDSTIAPCPVQVDRALKGYCTIERNNAAWCAKWLCDAMRQGLTVGRVLGTGRDAVRHTCSVSGQRKTIALRLERQNRAATGDDDDIPF